MKRSRQTIRKLLEALDMECTNHISVDSVTFDTFINFVNNHGIESRYLYYFKNGKVFIEKNKESDE